jgi:hypothetical protein
MAFFLQKPTTIILQKAKEKRKTKKGHMNTLTACRPMRSKSTS